MKIKADSKRMKGILQQYDVQASNGFERMQQELKERSRSHGRDLLTQMSERKKSVSPDIPRDNHINERSVPVLNNYAGIDPKIRFGDSFQTEKRNNAQAMNESKNKALQHDMDLRFENQDRMINYLMQQLQGMEQSSMSGQRKANELSEKDREAAQKRLLDLKISHDNTSATLADVLGKLNMLTSEQARADQIRLALADKLRNSEE